MSERKNSIFSGIILLAFGIGIAILAEPWAGMPMGLIGLLLFVYGLTQSEAGERKKTGRPG